MRAMNSGTCKGSANGQKLIDTGSRLSTAKNAAASRSGTPTIQNRSFMRAEIEPKPRGRSIRPAARKRHSRLLGVELLAQLFAGLEERHGLFGHLDRFAGARVAPDARLPPL